MRITHRMIADTVNFNLQGSLRRLERYSNQLSTGKMFQRPSENPVGVGRVMSYSASIARNEQFRLNMNQSKGWLERTENALQGSLDVMQRIRELTIYGANESLTAEDRRAIAPEVFEFIDHLVGIANTESNGLYIFGGHQTLKAPFVRQNVYGLEAHHLKAVHTGHAEFRAGALQAGTEGRVIGLDFTLDGEKFSVTLLSGGNDPEITYGSIKNAIENHSRLGQYIGVSGDENGLILTRLTPGDFTVQATTAEAAIVIENLAEGETVNLQAAEQNIATLGDINPNSFLTGEYRLLAETSDDGYGIDDGTMVFEYSQSGQRLFENIEAVAAPQNQSAALMVTSSDDDEVTFSYRYKQVSPIDGSLITGTGFFTVNQSDPAPQLVTIGDVTYSLSLNEAQFAAGDKIVVNTGAEVIADAKLVQLYREEELQFAYAFSSDAPAPGSLRHLDFFSLDPENGALLEPSMTMEWNEGAGGAFDSGSTLEFPAAGFRIGDLSEAGSFPAREELLSAAGLQNGTYRFEQAAFTAVRDFESEVKVVQQHLQGSAASIFTGSADSGQVEINAVNGAKNASVLLEVTGTDPENGLVNYSYISHEYALDGTYEKAVGTFEIVLGGEGVQVINLGDVQVEFRGLDAINRSDAGALTGGDRAVLDLIPAMEAGSFYNRLDLAGGHRGGDSGACFIFSDQALAGRDTGLRYFSLDTFERSPDTGKVYDGMIQVNNETLDLLRLPRNMVFHYDSSGFPVYYGDKQHRVQEISPHQEVIMNLHGEIAFGENQEIFEAVYSVYRSLIDNDREALGGEALEKMDGSIDRLLENLSQVGARANRVEAMQDTLFSENLYLREVRSNIEDIDLAYVITEFTMQENAYRAALATASMMMQQSLVDYLR